MSNTNLVQGQCVVMNKDGTLVSSGQPCVGDKNNYSTHAQYLNAVPGHINAILPTLPATLNYTFWILFMAGAIFAIWNVWRKKA